MKTVLDRTIIRIGLVYLLGVLAAMVVSEAVPELSDMAREFHPQNPSLIGLIMSLPSLVVVIGALAAGYLVDRIGDRPVLIAGAVIVLLGDLGVIAAPSLSLLLAARVVGGIGYLLMAVAAVVMLMRITTGRQRIWALALWATFVPVSFILPFLTAGLAASAGSWRVAFGSHAIVLAALLGVGLLILPGRAESATAASRTAGLAQVLRSPLIYLLGLSFGADAFLQSGIIASFGPYLARHYGANVMAINGWNVGAMISNTIGALAVGRLLNRGIAAHLIGFVGMVLTGLPAFLLFAFPIGIGPSIAASWVFTFGSGLLVGMWALLPAVAPSPQAMGASSGLVTQITLLGVLLGAPVIFAAQAAPGPGPMLFVLALGLLLCLAAVPIWLRASGRPIHGMGRVAALERR